MTSPIARTKGRLLLFERDAGKRYHFAKYVEGIMMRNLCEAERQEVLLTIIKARRDEHGDAKDT